MTVHSSSVGLFRPDTSRRPRKSGALRLALAGAALAALAPTAHANVTWGNRTQAAPTPISSPKTDAALAQQIASPGKGGAVSVIARTRGPLSAAQNAQIKQLGGALEQTLWIVHSVALRLPRRSLGPLAALPFITHLSYDGAVTKCDEFVSDASGASQVYANPFQYNVNGVPITGAGVTVAVLDSGIHPNFDLNAAGGLPLLKSAALMPRILASIDFVAPGTPAVKPGNTDNDQCGHGTHVSGIIAGNGIITDVSPGAFRHLYGVARQANLLNVRVLDKNGASTVSQVLAGIQWVVASKDVYHVKVINLSLGHPVGESCTTDPLCQALEAAWQAGIVVVCAAGNNGRLNAANTPGLDNEGWGTAYGSVQSPGNDPSVITVGAMKAVADLTQGPYAVANRATDTIATYSSRGPSRLDLVLKPDLVAPGNRVISTEAAPNSTLTAGPAGKTNDLAPNTWIMGPGQPYDKNAYFRLSGTSMATPVVSGAAALLLQANPGLSPDSVKARLMLSADKWTDSQGSGDPLTYGAGYLDIPAALASTVVAATPALSPSVSQDGSGNVFINMDHAVWGNSLWGTGITDLHAVWGNNALWGSNALSSSHAVWGNSVWGDHAVWGNSTTAVDLSGTALGGE